MSDFLKVFNLCNRPTLPVSRSPHLVYFISELLPGALLAEVQVPLNLVIALDRSANMAGERLRILKQAISWLVEKLQPEDVISVVVFGKQARVVIPARKVDQAAHLTQWAQGVRGVGEQLLAVGLEEALNQATIWRDSNRVNRILLVVGGPAVDAPLAAQQLAAQAGLQGISVICVGLGNDWDEDFLIELSDLSVRAQPGSRAGDVYYVSDLAQIWNTFSRIYQSMRICTRNTRMDIKPARGVQVRQVWQIRPTLREGRTPSAQGDQISIPIGEFGIEGASFLFETLLEPRPSGAVRIAQEDVSFYVPGVGDQLEHDEIVVEYSRSLAVTGRLEGYVMDIVQRAQSLKLQTQALHDAEAGQVEQAIQRLHQLVPVLMSQGEILLADRMRKEVDHLQKYRQISDEGRKLIRLAFRER